VEQSASFTVVASGTIVSYQWKFNGANISDGYGIQEQHLQILLLPQYHLQMQAIFMCCDGI
jgi:hypothetical protein